MSKVKRRLPTEKIRLSQQESHLIRSLCFLGVLLFCTACSAEPLSDKVEVGNSETPRHHNGDHFTNPYMGDFDKNIFSYLKMRYFGDTQFADQEAEAHKVPIADVQNFQALRNSESPTVTWLGHSTFLIKTPGANVLTDPILSKRASPVSFAGPKRLVSMPIAVEDLPPIQYVIISHDHYDHLDKETIEQLGVHPLYLVPLGLKKWFVSNGIPRDRVKEFDWWDQEVLPGLTVTATPSQHWSGRGLTDRMETLWASWHLKLGSETFWFGGDTGYNAFQFKEIGERLGPVDVGLIPIGAYGPRWFMEKHHVDPTGAINIHNDINARLSIGMHWGTFQLTSEPIMEPKELLEQLVEEGKLDQGVFTTLAIGETVQVSPAVLQQADRGEPILSLQKYRTWAQLNQKSRSAKDERNILQNIEVAALGRTGTTTLKPLVRAE